MSFRWLQSVLVLLVTLFVAAGSLHATFQESPKTASGVFGIESNIDAYRSRLVSEGTHRENTIVVYDPATGVWFYVNQNPWTFWDPLGLEVGKPYDSIDDAAMALAYDLVKGKYLTKENGGGIYRQKVDGEAKYFHTEVVTTITSSEGSTNREDKGTSISLPHNEWKREGKDVVAALHNHPRWILDKDGSIVGEGTASFSAGKGMDLDNAKNTLKMTYYLVANVSEQVAEGELSKDQAIVVRRYVPVTASQDRRPQGPGGITIYNPESAVFEESAKRILNRNELREKYGFEPLGTPGVREHRYLRRYDTTGKTRYDDIAPSKDKVMTVDEDNYEK